MEASDGPSALEAPRQSLVADVMLPSGFAKGPSVMDEVNGGANSTINWSRHFQDGGEEEEQYATGQ